MSLNKRMDFKKSIGHTMEYYSAVKINDAGPSFSVGSLATGHKDKGNRVDKQGFQKVHEYRW